MASLQATTPRPLVHGGRSAPKRHRPSVTQRNQRVERYRLLVRPIARHYQRCTPEPLEDLEQVGLLGLLRAAELYHPERHIAFEAFARPHIRGAILHYLRDQARPVRLSRRQMELEDRVRQLNRRPLSHGAGAEGGEAWLRRLGVSQEQWQRFLWAQQLSRPLSLESVTVEEPAARSEAMAPERSTELLASVQELEPRSRRAVQLVVLAGLSLRGAARQVGSSPATVQRDLRKGLAQLRRRLEPFTGSRHLAASGVPAC
jgi:RNA polymerase sigma-B factor